ncbi:hypothetical protein NST74_15230 [Paenibacillus sp. FSL F4-0125]|uniref:hypothetical protein n=1 Tax=Paenibacillus sp. FSL F4-0125 TaxID=2954730 RepID=UPI0030FCCFF7
MRLELVIIIFLLFLNIPVYKVLFRVFFADNDDYNETVRHSFTPNIISLFRGEYWKDRLNTARLQFFIMICVGIVVLEYLVLTKIIDIFR